MAKPVKHLTAASLSRKEAMSCRLSSGGGGHAQRFGSLLPCGMTIIQTHAVRGMSSTRPAPAVNSRGSHCNSMQHKLGRGTSLTFDRDDGSHSGARKAIANAAAAELGNVQDPNQHNSGSEKAYPKGLHCQLSMVDILEKMGISHHFAHEVKSVLDMTYSRWSQRDEEIMLHIETCAMAFRLLRMNGYDVSSDDLSHVVEAFTLQERYLSDNTSALLELHKASEVTVSEDDFILDTIGSWSGSLLKEQLRSSDVQTTPLLREVGHTLNCPFYTTLDRLDHRKNIEHFAVTGSQMLETICLPAPCQTYEDLLGLAVRDFSSSQSLYQLELQCLVRWVKESRLDQLPFARQKLAYFYLSAAGAIFPQELSDARISWAKNGALITVVDDFFDMEGSEEELENLVALVEMWDDHGKIEYYSEQVEIVFSAIYNSVNELGAKASELQNRDVTKHLVEIWLDLLKSMRTEVYWKMNKYVPTTEEYMKNASLTFALGPIVLPALYFVGPQISEAVVRDPEYNELFRLMSTCGRLLNDAQSDQRECSEGKVNMISLLVHHSDGSMSIEEARREMQRPIDACRRELLRLVLRKEGAVPRPCKELFWKMCKVCYFFYSETDAFSSPVAKVGEVNAVISEPLQLVDLGKASRLLSLSGVATGPMQSAYY